MPVCPQWLSQHCCAHGGCAGNDGYPTAFQWAAVLSLVVPRKTPFGMKQNWGWRAGMGIGLWEWVSLTHSRGGRPAERRVRRPLTWLALHCRAQARNRKGNTTPTKARVPRVGTGGWWGKIVLYFRALVAQKLLANFWWFICLGSVSPTPFVCRSLQIVGVEFM